MRNLSKNFENKSINYEKLLEYGFFKKENCFIMKIKFMIIILK